MNRKVISIFGVVLFILALNNCSSNPEQGLLDRYFNALSLNDIQTLSSMAIEPVTFEFDSWKITNVSEEVITPSPLADLNAKELELKKQVGESVVITLNASDALEDAKFEKDNARTAAARRAAQGKISGLQDAYDEQYAKHLQIQKDKNQAEEEAAREEQLADFSTGGNYTGIRNFVGEIHSKEVDIEVKGSEGTNHYKLYLRIYNLKDEVANLSARGRWVIVKFEKID